MRSDHPPRLALALLERVARENEPLIGDMIEGWSERSDAWFWRQALLAAAAHMSLRLRSGSRATVEHGLVSVAMLSLLGFYAVVAASFMNHLLFLNHPDWMTATGS